MGGRRSLWLALGVAVLALAGCVALAVLLAEPEGPAGGKKGPAGPPPAAAGPAAREEVPAPAGPRRLPVAGAEGYWVLLNPDGSSVMEGPGGVRTPLAGPSAPKVPDALARRLEERVRRPPPRRGVGQLVICDGGVVDVPREAVITFIGKDKVVCRYPDGSSSAHYTDGRVERRDRPGAAVQAEPPPRAEPDK